MVGPAIEMLVRSMWVMKHIAQRKDQDPINVVT